MNPIHEMLIAQGKMNDPDPKDPADSVETPAQLVARHMPGYLSRVSNIVKEAMENESLPTISSHLPDMVDSYITTRAQRLVLAKEVEAMEEAEKELYKTIIAKLREGGMSAMGGKMGVVKLHETVEPIAENWPETWAYIKANDAFELLHKRLTVTAVKERWEHGEEVPGVGRVPKFSLSVSK